MLGRPLMSCLATPAYSCARSRARFLNKRPGEMTADLYPEQPRIASVHSTVTVQMLLTVVHLVLRPSRRNALDGQDLDVLSLAIQFRITCRKPNQRDKRIYGMNLWVDESRTPPDGWVWAQTSSGAIDALCFGMVERLSLNYDLGDDTTRLVIRWMHENRMWPREIRVHSADPADVECLTGMIDRCGK